MRADLILRSAGRLLVGVLMYIATVCLLAVVLTGWWRT